VFLRSLPVFFRYEKRRASLAYDLNGSCDSLTSSTKLYSRFLASDADKVVIFLFSPERTTYRTQHRMVVKSILGERKAKPVHSDRGSDGWVALIESIAILLIVSVLTGSASLHRPANAFFDQLGMGRL